MPSEERVQVKTRVPPEQKARWSEAAAEREMSQSEFVRTMVQAGLRGFESAADGGSASNPDEIGSAGSTPGGNGLESRVEAVLDRAGVMDWDALLAELTGDMEDRLEEALAALQDEGRVRYSGRDGGYVLVDDEQ